MLERLLGTLLYLTASVHGTLNLSHFLDRLIDYNSIGTCACFYSLIISICLIFKQIKPHPSSISQFLKAHHRFLKMKRPQNMISKK